MTTHHDDTHTGVQLVAVMHAERAELSAESFVVPSEHKVVDETTDNSPRAIQ
jgi:hypothetical protein